MIRPKEMTKISILGPKTQLETVVAALHDLELLHIDDQSDLDTGLDIGSPQETADALSDTLIQLRSIRSRLPDVESDRREEQGEVIDHLEQLQTSIDDIYADLEDVRSNRESVHNLKNRLTILERLGLETTDITTYSSINMYVGTVSDYDFVNELPDGRYELHTDEKLMALFVDNDVDITDALREANFSEIDIEPVMDIEAPLAEELDRVTETVQQLDHREEQLEQELTEIAAEWRAYLDEQENILSRELEQAEAPLQFSVTDQTFIAEGWVPTETLSTLTERLETEADNSIHIEELEDDPHRTPVEHDNPKGVNQFEDLVGFFGIPSYNEVDPTFLLLSFPILFGFMLGDVGYGLTTFAVFYAFYLKFPEAEGLWKSLMYASTVTIIFGLIYGDMFGYIIFGHESVLAEVTGIHLFAEIPVLFHRAHELSTVLAASLLIGIAHVNLGYLVGAYNEYIHHGVMEAIFAKISWIVIEIGAGLAYLVNMYIGLGVMLGGVIMLYKGEGIEGVVEIPSLLSNILSYLRIFGVVIAIIALGAVVNTVAAPLFQSGNMFMIGLGVLILVIGHTINTFLKMLEAGLQGIRLHYVEFFTKFFEGGGQYYKPFGRKQSY